MSSTFSQSAPSPPCGSPILDWWSVNVCAAGPTADRYWITVGGAALEVHGTVTDIIVWATSVVGLLAIIVGAANALKGRGPRARAARETQFAEALRFLTPGPTGKSIPKTEVLEGHWEKILRCAVEDGAEIPDPGNSPEGLHEHLLAAVEVLHRVDSVNIDLYREALATATEYINYVNRFAARVDDELVRPIHLVRQEPDLHHDLLSGLPMVAPFIWYESLVKGRGRWGYRPARLGEIFMQLRAVSEDWEATFQNDVRVTIRVDQPPSTLVLASYPAISRARRRFSRLRYLYRTPTINRRSKSAQTKTATRIRGALSRRGISETIRIREVTPW